MKLSKTQQALIDILGRRFLFYWAGQDSHFQISHVDDGYRHGHYDRARDQQARAARVTGATVYQAIQKGALEKVATFQADATGRKAYIFKARRA